MDHIVGIDIGGTKIARALVSLGAESAQLNYLESIPTEAAQGGAHVLERVLASVERVLAAATVEPQGVGISSAGVIDPFTGVVSDANDIMPGWAGTKLAAAIEEHFSLPCRALNDVHAHALGEARRGVGKNAASCLVAAVGTGIGGAFVQDGKLMLGAHGVAGHIGHVSSSYATGVRCACGATGHVESVAAGPAIVKEYLRLGGKATNASGAPVNGADIELYAQEGDEAARTAQRRSGLALGEVLGSMCNMLDPELIILSGSVVQSGAAWHEALKEGFASSAMPPVAHVPICSGELGGAAPLIGAAENFVSSAY